MFRSKPIVEKTGEYAVIFLAGEVDLTAKSQILDSYAHAIPRLKVPHLLVDVSRVTYMDSTGMNTLVIALGMVAPLGGTISLVGASDRIRRLLQIVELDAAINVMPEESWAADRLEAFLELTTAPA